MQKDNYEEICIVLRGSMEKPNVRTVFEIVNKYISCEFTRKHIRERHVELIRSGYTQRDFFAWFCGFCHLEAMK